VAIATSEGEEGVCKMSYPAKMLVILASVFIMAGCGLQQYTKDANVAGYPYRYAAFDYKYAWKTVITDHGVIIEGMMKNVRYSFIDSVLLSVDLLDKDGKVLAKAADFPMPQQTGEGDVSYFDLQLRDIKPAPGDTFLFLVHYKGNEGGSHGNIDWISSFKVDALTGEVIKPPSRKTDNW